MVPENTSTNLRTNKKNRWLFKIVLLLCVLFFATSVAFLLLWKPWQANIKASDRTISVTGESTLAATPDEYVFTPSYDFTNPSNQTALNDMSAKSNDITAKLKSLGVADSAIKTDSSGYSGGGVGIYTPAVPMPVRQDNGSTTYTLNLTVTIDNADLAQKVQNYLLSTSPTGSVSPQASFSNAKQKTLQAQGRNKAEQDARTKADQSAKNLGFKVLAVKSVVDGSLESPIIRPLEGAISSPSSSASPTLTLQPGQNTLNYSVNVIYYIH